MRDLPRPEVEPQSPALAGEFLTTGPPGKSPTLISIYLLCSLNSTQWNPLPIHFLFFNQSIFKEQIFYLFPVIFCFLGPNALFWTLRVSWHSSVGASSFVTSCHLQMYLQWSSPMTWPPNHLINTQHSFNQHTTIFLPNPHITEINVALPGEDCMCFWKI